LCDVGSVAISCHNSAAWVVGPRSRVTGVTQMTEGDGLSIIPPVFFSETHIERASLCVRCVTGLARACGIREWRNSCCHAFEVRNHLLLADAADFARPVFAVGAAEHERAGAPS